MSGTSNPMTSAGDTADLGIRIEPGQGRGYVGPWEFEWQVKDEMLVEWSKQTLEAFYKLEVATNDGVRLAADEGRPLVEGLTLGDTASNLHLQRLAEYGFYAYWECFKDPIAQQALAEQIKDLTPKVPAPTFFNEAVLFPWECLYEGADFTTPDIEKFWGFRYAPARVLVPKLQYKPLKQDQQADMLFCLHRSLRQARCREWPDVRRLVAEVCAGQANLLSQSYLPAPVKSGRELLTHLTASQHNMIHFACHATQNEAGEDVLRMTPIDPADVDRTDDLQGTAGDINLGTRDFIGPGAEFAHRKPLVILNACKSGGGADTLRVYYNLPHKFVTRGAAAVIATACAVPDVFAAEFARIFYEYFLAGRDPLATDPAAANIGPQTIAAALRSTRRYFWQVHRNPLGLAYGLYSPANYRVNRTPAAGGAIA